MNKVILVGNLTAAPETRKTEDGITLCRFRLAVQRGYRDKATGEQEADYFTITCWRKLAETCGAWLGKGRKVTAVCHLRSQSYEDSTGNRRYTVDLIADEVEFLSSRQQEEETRSAPGATANAPFPEDEDMQLPF